MAVNPINVSRVSQNLQTTQMISSFRANQLNLFGIQSRIAAGRSFLSPSDDPVAATRAIDLTQALGRQNQFLQNIQHGDSVLTATDTAINEVESLLIDASAVASQNLSNLTSAAERFAEAEVVAAIREQLLVVGNREFDGRFIFAGRDTTVPPFTHALGGVSYIGDTGDLLTRISEDFTAVTNVPGNLLFGALSSRIASNVDLSPALTADLRLEDIEGTRGETIRGGTLVINEIDGAGPVPVSLSAVDTIGDIVDAINAAASANSATFSAQLSSDGLTIIPGANAITVTDTNADVVASNLGVLTNSPTTDNIEGLPLDARLSRLTAISDLAGGSGIDIDSGFVISNGENTATIDLSDAETVQDIINIINNADVGVMALINDDATGIDVLNRVSGTSLTVGENGGTTAADLGIRTMDNATELSSINFGRGFNPSEDRADFQITARNGATVDVDVESANTIGDVIDLINAAAQDAGVSISAAFAEVGNGIRIIDSTGGAGVISVANVGTSLAAIDLGIFGSTTGTETELVGVDVNPTRTDGILSALVELERALRADDTQGIAAAGERVDNFVPEVTRTHGIVGARGQAMQAKLRQTQEAAQTTEIFLSELKDLDFAEAATRLQAATTQLQASFQSSSILFNLSLINFLR
ncbi:MAG: flagellar hook-associated protein FlgL [Planctomycetota bacterium]|jgi:flagellar hook-associated protein 3